MGWIIEKYIEETLLNLLKQSNNNFMKENPDIHQRT